jgi:hypothetical protein
MLISCKLQKSEIIENIERDLLDGNDMYLDLRDNGWKENTKNGTNRILEESSRSAFKKRGDKQVDRNEERALFRIVRETLLPKITADEETWKSWIGEIRKTNYKALEMFALVAHKAVQDPDKRLNLLLDLFPPREGQTLESYQSSLNALD